MSTLSAMMACHKDMLKLESSIAQLQKKAATFDSANEVGLLPAADAYVQDGANASTNYGDNSWLIAKDDASGYRRDIYLRFDLTALPSNITSVQSVRIELAGGVASAADTANAKWLYYTTLEKDWGEKTINWNNAPATGEKLGEINGKLKVTNGIVYFDIPVSVLQAALDSDRKLSIKIVAQRKITGSTSFYSDFQSKEAQDVIDNWLHTRYNFYKTQSVRTNNWETIRNLLMIDIAYILNDGTLINQATSDFSTHHNKNYRADGASVDFLGRDAFAYHVYDMEFMGQIGRTLYIKRGRATVDSLVNHRATKWVNLRINSNDSPVLGGSIADAVSFMSPYVMDPANNIHLEFVNTEWAPDKTRADYNKPFNAAGSSYAFVQMAAIMKNEMFGFLRKLNPSFTRYTDLRYYINSFGPSLSASTAANVTLYGDTPFRGWYKQLSVGNYSLTDLQGLGIANDQLSSISVPNGFKVTLYENGDFTGNSVLLTGHAIDLSILNFNDKTSSLVVEHL